MPCTDCTLLQARLAEAVRLLTIYAELDEYCGNHTSEVHAFLDAEDVYVATK
jgi:hypothetical protein